MNALIQLLRQNPDQVSAIVGVLALCVSFLSILLTVVSLYLSRRHNYKSLTPIASIPFSDYEDKLAVKIKNAGVGPLIIETFRATKGNRTEDDLISFMPELPRGVTWDTFFDDLDGACIRPGEQLAVLQLNGDSEDRGFAEARDACRRVLSQSTVVLTYKDIYGRRMPTVTKNLRWFGRHFETE
jgi:hypothetical protein